MQFVSSQPGRYLEFTQSNEDGVSAMRTFDIVAWRCDEETGLAHPVAWNPKRGRATSDLNEIALDLGWNIDKTDVKLVQYA